MGTHTAPHRFAIEPLEPRQLFSAGDFDPTFGGGDGFQSFTFPAQVQLTAIFDSAVQSDGKTLLAGQVDDSASGQGLDFAVARLNADGSPDTSFAFGGIFVIPFPGQADEADGVAVQADGKIVVAGSVALFQDQSSFFVLRLNPDGSIDQSFGAGLPYGLDGGVLPNLTVQDPFNPGERHDTAEDIAIQPDGKIVVAGAAGNGMTLAGGSPGHYVAVARFNPDGSLDPTFGNSDGFGGHVGYATVTLFSDDDAAFGVALQPDGKIVTTGYSLNAQNFDVHFFALRLTSDGLVDHSFAGGGVATAVFPPSDPYLLSFAFGTEIAVQPDDKVVVAGFVVDVSLTSFDFDIGLARFNPDGSPDATFGGGGGALQTNFGFLEAPSAILFQPDGKILVAGKATASTVAPFTFNIAVIGRYNPDGSLDNTFSDDGEVVVLPGQFNPSSAAPARLPPGTSPDAFLSAAVLRPADVGQGDFNSFAQSSAVTLQMVRGGGIRAQFVLGQTIGEFQLTGDAPVTVTAGDLTIAFVPLGRSFNVGEAGAVVVTITNNGPAAVTGNPAIALLFSTDAVVDANDLGLVQTNVPVSLTPGASTQATLNFTTPAGAPAGDYALVARVNGDRGVDESDFDDNDAATAFPVTVPTPPTLAATLKGGGKIKRGKAAKFTVQLNNLTQLLLQGTAVLAFQVTDAAGQNPRSGGANKSQKLKLKKGKNQKVTVSYKVPKTLAPGTYTYHVTVNAAHLSAPTANPLTLAVNFTVV